MRHRPVEMRELRVPLADIKRLSEQERFTYYLLGHMFNELISLQKIVAFAVPKHDDIRPARLQPEMGQLLLLFRLACGKLWEAHDAINKRAEVSETLRQRVFPKRTNGGASLQALNKAFGAAPWLSKMRNRMGFHFPSFSDWQPLLLPDDSWEPDSIYMSEMKGNTFYASSESIAQVWMFGLLRKEDVKEAVEPMIEQMIDLLTHMTDFLEAAIGDLVSEVVLTGHAKAPVVGKVLASEFEKVSLPFWTAMPPKK